MLRGKNVIVGVTGSIAAYKIAAFVRLLIKEECAVKVVLTDAAKEFITPLTLATLSKNPVLSAFTEGEEGEWNNHVELGLWGDAMVIAPATANTMAKMANGQVDNLLLATYLSARCPVFVAPAMDLDMYHHPGTQKNLETLKANGNHIIQVNSGELASGLTGEGRMSEPEEMLEVLQQHFEINRPLKDKKVLISAGPTHEKIDPVRYLGNNSSGKMGFQLAEAAAAQGAEVTLVTGPTALQLTDRSIQRIDVVSAQEMYDVCSNQFKTANIAIMAAAVADFTPGAVADKKIKKDGGEMVLKLKPTIDILNSLGEQKTVDQLLVGFALETNDELENAQKKLAKKNLDFIVLNSMNDAGAGFQHDTNKITIVEANNKFTSFELKSKQEVAKDIIGKIIDLLK
jgi:phosphopantothenoylcysteine decarboxylase/phosphopantothenate--cysteine ligase